MHYKRHKPKKYQYSNCGYYSCVEESVWVTSTNNPKRYGVSYWKNAKLNPKYIHKNILQGEIPE